MSDDEDEWNATLGKSAEWWEARDRAIAERKARDATSVEHQRVIERAGELKANGFPSLCVIAASSDSPLDTAALRHARTFVQTRKRILVFGGGVGTGKSTAAAWVALKGHDRRPGFVSASELERRGRYDKALDGWVRDRTSLVIDDVGAEVLDGKGVFRSLMDEIVNMFYGHGRTLLLTTNLRPRRADGGEEQFHERYGDRVWSRLRESGAWADCGMRDLRRDQLEIPAEARSP